MCLAIPGKIVSVGDETDPMQKTARVNFNGIVKQVCLAYVPDAEVGDYVIVHVGFALQKVDPDEATQVFDYLEKIGELGELEAV